MAAAENELRQVERLGGTASNPYWPNGDGPLADRLFEEEEAERLVSSELLSELSEPPIRQSCHSNQDRCRLEEPVTSRSQRHRSALAQLRSQDGRVARASRSAWKTQNVNTHSGS